MKKKNLLERKLPKDILEQLPPGMLLAEELEKAKTLSRIAKSQFHKSEKYSCFAFYKPISRMISNNFDD